MKTPKVIRLALAALVVLMVASLTACNSEAQTAPAATITEVTTATWQHEVIDSKLPVFVYFYSTNCKPCDDQYPLVEDLSKEYAGKVKFVKIDVVTNHEVRDGLNILRVPTMWVMKMDEKTIFTEDNNLDKAALKKFLEDGLAKKRAQP